MMNRPSSGLSRDVSSIEIVPGSLDDPPDVHILVQIEGFADQKPRRCLAYRNMADRFQFGVDMDQPFSVHEDLNIGWILVVEPQPTGPFDVYDTLGDLVFRGDLREPALHRLQPVQIGLDFLQYQPDRTKTADLLTQRGTSPQGLPASKAPVGQTVCS